MTYSGSSSGIIFDIKEFGIHDGPGLRTTVFFKGCPLRCSWCHNPEGLKMQPEIMVRTNGCTNCGLCKKPCEHPECKKYGRCLHICPMGLINIVGEEISADELAKRILKTQAIPNPGGVTFSGGEPLLQAEFIMSVMDKLKGLPIAIETSGYADSDVFRKVIRKCDLVYMDIKLALDTEHIKYTGVSNKPILKNLEILKHSGKKAVIRTPLIPNVTDSGENIALIKDLIGDLTHELLPFNDLWEAKYSMLPDIKCKK